MQIIDTNGHSREPVSLKRAKLDEEYIEAEFKHPVTHQRWKEWYPVKEFQQKNPDTILPKTEE
jgi:hypothetical protein